MEHPEMSIHSIRLCWTCEIDLKWYYVAAHGSIFLRTTQVIL